ncbi:MAG: general secretion pathway protein C [Comamonadaceae bacterium]|nr:MAG: general secretion pathway protein C [Comamonadaceae bacterium]
MVSNSQSRWAVRAATFFLWGLAAASAAYWALMLSRPQSLASAPAVRASVPVDAAAVARLLGFSARAALPTAPAPAPGLATRFALVGVVAGRSRRGAALIAIDGKPARPFRVGGVLEDGLVLQAVDGRKAVLAASAAGPALLTLELPPLKR